MINSSMCSSTDLENCKECSKKILGWTIFGNAFLASIKLAGGILTNSSGLIADGFQSISCVATSILIMVSLFLSKRRSDALFPFGYAKIEFIASLAAFSILIGIGLYIVFLSMLGIFRQDFVQADIMALPIAMVSAFLTYMMYRYNLCAGTKLESPGMVANGAHAGADLISSGAVILAIILAQFGSAWAVCDKIAALIVGLIIIRDSLSHWTSNLQIILDHVPNQGFQAQIKKVVFTAAPKYKIGKVKFKRIGKNFWVGISLLYPFSGTVKENEVLMDDTRKELIKAIPEINEVEFFIEIV
ncbi:MAG: cation transporter [Candidatus Omnitrophica bacterium]|nr:cation transporter [Candidatus Omnitrophota bacterium]